MTCPPATPLVYTGVVTSAKKDEGEATREATASASDAPESVVSACEVTLAKRPRRQ